MQIALGDLNTASQKGLGEMFDGSIGAGSVLNPFGGKNQLTPPDAMVAKIPLLDGDTTTCTHMSWGFNPNIANWSPFHGALYAVTESVCRIVASGAQLSDIRLTLQEYFEKLGNDPARWGKPFAALLGAFLAQHELRLGAIGGKDSMSGSFNDIDVPPTLVSFAVAPGTTQLALSPEFKQAGSAISIISVPRDSEGIPDFKRLQEIASLLYAENKAGHILSIHSLAEAGIAAGVAKMAFGNGIGAELNTELDLYQERYFSFLIESSDALTEALQATQIGTTTSLEEIQIDGERIALDALLNSWTSPLESTYPTQVKAAHQELSEFSYHGKDASLQAKSTNKVAKPKVIIPTFPGTNCEYDTAKAFNQAGADANTSIFRNLTAAHVEDSLRELAEQINQSQILMLPGGFSAGDEPDGSGKFIATVLRNPRISDAVMDLITNRDGLILGICNGFQALIKTGLVPYGEIKDPPPVTKDLRHSHSTILAVMWLAMPQHVSPQQSLLGWRTAMLEICTISPFPMEKESSTRPVSSLSNLQKMARLRLNTRISRASHRWMQHGIPTDRSTLSKASPHHAERFSGKWGIQSAAGKTLPKTFRGTNTSHSSRPESITFHNGSSQQIMPHGRNKLHRYPSRWPQLLELLELLAPLARNPYS